MKVCKTCKTEKPLADFYKTKAWVCGFSSSCRICKPRYNEKTRLTLMSYSKKYFESLPKDKKKKINKQKNKNIQEKITDGFVRVSIKRIFKNIGLEVEVSKEMIGAYRETLKVKRMIKEMKK